MAATKPPGKTVAVKESDGFVRAIARGFGVVEALGRPPGRHTLSEVARLANVTRATARRILATLVAMRYCASAQDSDVSSRRLSTVRCEFAQNGRELR